MLAAISPNFDLDQSSNLLARTTHEFLWVCESAPLGEAHRYRDTGD